MRRISFAPFHPAWWQKRYSKPSRRLAPDFMLIQVIVLIALVSGATIATWIVKGSLQQFAVDSATLKNFFVLLLLLITFVEVAIAGWTSLPQVTSLAEAKEQAEHLFKIAIDPIVVVNEKGILVQVNPAAEQLFRTSAFNLLQYHLSEFFPNLDARPELWENRSEHMLKLNRNSSINPARKSSRNQRIIEISISSRFHEEFREYVGILRDITDRKQAEEALRIAEENYRSIFENALEGIFQSAPDGKFISVNPAMARIYGYDSPQQMLEGITDIGEQLYVHQSERDEFRRLMRERGQVENFEHQAHRRDGSIFWAEIDARMVRDRNAQVAYYEGIVQDISDRKRQKEILEAMVKERTADLAAANKAVAALNERLKADNLRMGAELDILRQMQQLILPKQQELEDIEELDIVGYMEPADEVGGDYYDVLHTDGIVTIGIGDVTGHGLESGILMVMAQTAVRTLKEIQEQDSVRFLDTLNRTIYKNVSRMNSDKNLTLAILNYVAGAISISGQHEETIVVRKGGQIERIDTIDLGLPIGLDEEIADFISHTTVKLEPGDGVVLYTDGIPEARDIHGKFYGMERLCAVVSQTWHQDAEQVKQAVIEDVRRFIGEQKVFDDITLVVFKRKDYSVGSNEMGEKLTNVSASAKWMTLPK
jgi:PAS domain S-box-containing protein